MDLQKLLKEAWVLKRQDKAEEALKLYGQAFDILTKEAKEHARSLIDTQKNEEITRIGLPKYFEKAKEYLKKDKVVCTLLNDMGTILAQLGDEEGARNKFVQAIDLTPEGEDFPDPHLALKRLI